MKHKQIKLIAMLLSTIGLAGLHAQETLPATGGEASGSGGTISYTVGQIVYSTNTGTNGSEAQGVQQPYEIWMVTALDEMKNITLHASVYPNPVSDFLTLKIQSENKVQYLISLYDANGKLFESKKTDGVETSIDMTKYTPAVYYLKVTSNNATIKTFKILKNKTK
jgi:hypothetical protein